MTPNANPRLVPEDGGWNHVKVKARELVQKRAEEILRKSGKLRATANIDDYLAAVAQAEAELGDIGKWAQINSKGKR
jgi:hypothetical protein